MVVLMMCFNLFSHGTQDLYPTFLQKQLNFDPATVSWITIVANLGAIAGGLGVRLRVGEDRPRQRDHPRGGHRAADAAAVGLFDRRRRCSALGAFVMQVAVQGAWGVVPAHLNELSPGAARATIPAFVYQARQLSRLLQRRRSRPRSPRPTAETTPSRWRWLAGVVAVAMIVVIRFSPEKRGEHLTAH